MYDRLSFGPRLGKSATCPHSDSCRPLHTCMEALGGEETSCQPVLRGEKDKEKEEEEPGRGSPQPTTTLAVAGGEGQEPEPPQIRVADYTPEVSEADEGYQTAGQTGESQF